MTPLMLFLNKQSKRQGEFLWTCHKILKTEWQVSVSMCPTSLTNALQVWNGEGESTLRFLRQSGCWIIQGGEQGGRQMRRFWNVEPLSMVSFIEPLSRAWRSSMRWFPHSLGQGGIRHRAEEGLRGTRKRGKEFHILIASKPQPSPEFPSCHTFCCHFKVSTHLTQVSRVNYLRKRCLNYCEQKTSAIKYL